VAALAIRALGAISSVGRGVVESCASIRAGMNRAHPVPHFPIMDGALAKPMPLTGHPVAAVTDGFGPSARWLFMARRALADLAAGDAEIEQADAGYWSRCGVLFVLPVLADARFFSAPPARPDTIWASCLDVLCTERGLAASRQHRELVAMGAGGIARALEIGGGWLDRRELDRVLIIAVDSLLDAWSLDWLTHARRLKDGANPVGLSPGEAAVALLIEGQATRPAGRPAAHIRAFAFEEADEPFPNAERRQGRAAIAALGRALQAAGPMLEGDVYVNLNGEEWRAAELGAVLSALPAGVAGNYRVHAPAISVGDVGAAAGALQIACAVRSFARGYALGGQAWVLATSEYGDVSALCIGEA